MGKEFVHLFGYFTCIVWVLVQNIIFKCFLQIPFLMLKALINEHKNTMWGKAQFNPTTAYNKRNQN